MAIELTAADIITELDRRIRARVPITAVVTHEEPRFLRILDAVHNLPVHKDKRLFIWSRTKGFCEMQRAELLVLDQSLAPVTPVVVQDTMDPVSALEFIDQQEGSGLYVLADFGPYLAEPGPSGEILVRLLRELAWTIKSRRANVFIVGPHFPDIPALEKEVHPLDLDLPGEREVQAILDARLSGLRQNERAFVNVDDTLKEELTGAMSGLTEDEAETALAMATVTLGGLDRRAVPIILEHKKEAIRKSGSLTFTPPEPLDFFGGYSNLISLVRSAAATFTPEARAFGIDPHKGFLLIGPPGCGKDYLKKVISGIVNRALLDMDFGAVMGEGGGIIGQAAMSIRRALSIATALKPVLGMSEFEKAVSGLGSAGRSDGGETSRTIGMLLNWMADQTSCMIVATANDVRQLAPEQIREGRFGAKIWVGLPSEEDRAAIFKVHLKKRGRQGASYDYAAFAERSERFSGAEIEQAVKNGLLRAFMDARELHTTDILDGIADITPTGIVNRAEIDDLQKWAEQNLGAISATAPARELLTSVRPGTYADRPIEVG